MSSTNRDCVERAAASSYLGQTEITIDELARLAQSGNAEAFAVLATRLRPRLLVVLSKRLRGRIADAEDVTQDTLTKAWSRIQSYDSNRSFTAWLYTIAFRRATDYLRHQERRTRHAQQLTSNESTTSTAQQSLMNQESADNLWSTAKRELTDRQYAALWLRYAEDFSIREVAATMGKTQVATRVLLHRARGKLQSLVASEHRSHET